MGKMRVLSVLAGIFAILMAVSCNNTANSKPNTNTYAVDATDIINGGTSEIFSIPTKPKAGSVVTLIVEPEPGKAIELLTIMHDGKVILYEQLDIRPNGTVRYTFTMPRGAVRVSASFVDLHKYRVIVDSMSNGTIQSDPEGSQYEQYPVELFSDAASGYKLNPASLIVTDDYEENLILHTVTPTGFIFMMPNMDVRVKSEFVPASTVFHNINTKDTEGGLINVPASAPAGYPVKVRLVPNLGYNYKSGSLKISGVSDITFEDDNLSAGFTMPDAAVTVSATFEKKPAFAITTAIKGQAKQGTFVSTVNGTTASEATAGAEVTLRLTVTTPANYRYKAGSFSLEGGSAKAAMTLNSREWIFIMPAAAVTATVEIEAGAAPPEPHFAITEEPSIGGSLSFAAETFIAGQGVESGDTVTITATPEGTAWEVGPTTVLPIVKRADGSTVKAARVSGVFDKWTFRMPAEPVTVTYQFAAVVITVNVVASPVTGGTVIVAGIENNKASQGDTITITSIPANEEFIPQPPTAFGFEFTSAGETPNKEPKWSITVNEVPISRTINILVPFQQKTYPITRGEVSGGTMQIAVNNVVTSSTIPEAVKGATITLIGTANSGHILADAIVTVTPEVYLFPPEAGQWTFSMPNEAVTIGIKFKSFKEAGGKVIYSNGEFDDIEGTLAGFNDPTHTFSPQWQNSVELDAVITGGRLGHTKAIRVFNNGAGEIGFTIKASTPIDLGGTGALSFWARKSATMENTVPIQVVGFGEATSNTVFYYGEENGGGDNFIEKNWKRHIVPVPVPKDGMETTNVFFMKLNLNPGHEMWIDDIEYLPASMVKLESIKLPFNLSNTIPASGTQNAFDMINRETNGYAVSYTTYGLEPATTASLFSKNRVNLEHNYKLLNWIPSSEFDVRVTGAATGGAEVTPVTPGGTFSITLAYNGVVSNSMTGNIMNDNELMLEDCQLEIPGERRIQMPADECYSGLETNSDLSVQGRKSYYAMWRAVAGSNEQHVAALPEKIGNKYSFLGIVFAGGVQNLSTYTKITFKVRVPVAHVVPPRERCEFYLRSGGSWYEYTDGFNHGGDATTNINITLNASKFTAPTKAGITPAGSGTINLNSVDAFAIGIIRDEEPRTEERDCRISFADVMAVK